jgi:nifR3 family TIM-barrel protein
MAKNFWKKLKKPIYALAPMAGVADSAFRQICKEFGADVVYSEMASAAALVYAPKKTLELIEFSKVERPFVAQLFGSSPAHFAYAARLLSGKKTHPLPPLKRGFIPDGIDINFGCPVKKVQKQGAGAVLMNNLKLSREIIKSVIDNTDLPVSIKIRAGAGKVDALKFLDNVRDLNIVAVMIHGRTLKQGFAGEADFKIIKKARGFFGGIILANGGIGLTPSPSPSQERGVDWLLEKTGADGIGIARGALGRPWIFRMSELLIYADNTDFTDKKNIFKIALKHAKLAEKLKGEIGIREMRKHLCWYVAGLPNARSLRQKLIEVNNMEDIEKIFKIKKS